MPVQTQILTRRGTAASWTSTNPTLGAGEIGYETDTGRFKIGTGAAAWASLGYFNKDPLTTKGDLYTFSTTDDRLAVGNNGESLVADSSTSTGLRYQGNYAAGKNKIINGNFNVWQRGTSFTFSGTGGYTADRFEITSGSGGVVTVTQGAFTPGAAPLAGNESQYFLNLNYTTSGTSAADNGQYIEDVRTFAGQTVTVSVYAKMTSGTHSITPQLVQRFGSGGSGASATSGTSFTATTSWQRFSATISVPSVSGKTIGAGSSLQLRLDLGTTGVKEFQFWGFQVEAGSVATAFQTATGTIQGELAACQRYYYRIGGSYVYEILGVGNARSTTVGDVVLNMPVSMRTAPSSIDFSNIALLRDFGSSPIAITSVAFSGAGKNSAISGCTVASGLTAGQNYYTVANNSTSAYLAVSAEL
jgi:hypothetical protein